MRTKFIALTGVILFALVSTTSAITRYVNWNNPSPVSPYTSWTTAATNIQQAINAAVVGDLVLVTNGTYQTGGRIIYGALSNRVAIDKAITVQSVNGPDVTVIRGYQVPGTIWGNNAVRCVYMTSNAVLSGFTLSTGATRNAGDLIKEGFGGGLWCESTNAVISNCVFTNNRAAFDAGGVYRGTLNNCVLVSNAIPISGGGINSGGGANASILNYCRLIGNSGQRGGGAYGSTMANCVLLGNCAEDSGGADFSTLINCTVIANVATNSAGGVGGTSSVRNSIVYYSTAPTGPNYANAVFNNSCSTPQPSGIGNIGAIPRFVDQNGGNLRLQTNSACINAGYNLFSVGSTDLDGRPRIKSNTVDMGAYEFQGAGIGEFIAWLQNMRFPIDGSADFSDADGDGANNWQEWRADTIPTNLLSALRLVSATNSSSGAVVTWQSVATRNYWLERATNLGVASSFKTVATNIVGTSGTKTFTDTTATGGGPYFYRVGVQ